MVVAVALAAVIGNASRFLGWCSSKWQECHPRESFRWWELLGLRAERQSSSRKSSYGRESEKFLVSFVCAPREGGNTLIRALFVQIRTISGAHVFRNRLSHDVPTRPSEEID